MEVTNGVQLPRRSPGVVFETQQILPPASGNDDSKEPSKRIYFKTIDVQQLCDLRKDGICRNRELKLVQSLSKTLKKKKHKNKKVDKILWDPSIQIPDLGNLTKYLKKKRKLAGITEVKEHRYQCSKKRIVEETGVRCKGKPEHTFDIISSKESYLDEVPQRVRESSVLDDVARSASQDFTPVSQENNSFLVGDLIDLGTPKTFRPKIADNNDKQLPAMLKIDEIEEIFNFHPGSSSFKESSSVPLIGLPKPAAPDSAESPLENEADSSNDSHEHEQESRETSSFVLGQEPQNSSSDVEGVSLSNQANICKIRAGKPSNPINSSPQHIDGSPGLTSSPEIESQHILLTGNPIGMLIECLEKDPFPHHRRINAKVIVRRRAFSMDDTLMKCWLSKSPNDVGGIFNPSEFLKIIPNQASDTLVVNNETLCDSSLVVENEGTGRITGGELKNFESNELTSNSENPINSNTCNIPTLPRQGLVDSTEEPLFKASPREEHNCLIIQSGTSVLSDVSDIKNDGANKILLKSSLQEESCAKAPKNMNDEDQDLEQALSVEQDGLLSSHSTQIAEVRSANTSTSNSFVMGYPVSAVNSFSDQVVEEAHSSGIETSNEELDHTGDSSLQPLESSDPDVMASNDTKRSTGTMKVLCGDESKIFSSNDSPPSLQTSIQNLFEENDVSDCSDLGFPLTESTPPYRLDGVSAFHMVTNNGILKPDSTSQKTVLQVEKSSTDISVEVHLGNENPLVATSICTPPRCNETEEGQEHTSGGVSECSPDEIFVSNLNSTFVVEPSKSEELCSSDQIGWHRNEIQEGSSGPEQSDSSTGSMHALISDDGSDVSHLNSTYVVGLGDSEGLYYEEPVDVHREKIHRNSSEPPQDSSACMTPATGDESKKYKINTVDSKGEITDTFDDYGNNSDFDDESCVTPLQHWVLPAGKKFRRSLSIIRNLNDHQCATIQRGRHYEKSVEEIIKLQGNSEVGTPVQNLRKRISLRRSSWLRQMTPPPVRRNTLIWSPSLPERGTLYETPPPRRSVYLTPMQQHVRPSLRGSPTVAPRLSLEAPAQYTERDLILTICKQIEPCGFDDILDENAFNGGCKLGEGVFGEVFSINRGYEHTVLKIIPIEGQDLINGEKQKTYSEVLSELIIAKVLHELRYEGSDESNLTAGYAQLISTSLVQGCYPKSLLELWEEFDQAKGSDNDHPKVFGEDQLFIVMEQGNGGKDLESYTFSSAKQSLSIFKQIAFSLAVAEVSVEFEHRDLHWGNVLVSKTSEKQIYFTLNGSRYSVASNGVKSTIIDYTLSCIKYVNQFPIYNDIGKDPEMFIATGDYQFDVYRLMKADVDDDWSRFAPKTNARWLHYLLDKILTKVKYQRKTAKVHKDSWRVLEEIGSWIEECESALSVALRLADMKN